MFVSVIADVTNAAAAVAQNAIRKAQVMRQAAQVTAFLISGNYDFDSRSVFIARSSGPIGDPSRSDHVSADASVFIATSANSCGSSIARNGSGSTFARPSQSTSGYVSGFGNSSDSAWGAAKIS